MTPVVVDATDHRMLQQKLMPIPDIQTTLKCALNSGSGGDTDSCITTGSWLLANDDLDIAIKRIQKMHEPFDRKSIQLVICQSRNLRLVDTKHMRSHDLRKPPSTENLVDCNR